MKNRMALLLCLVIAAVTMSAHGPNGKSFGFGLNVGEPLGLTLKVWNTDNSALAFALGSSYFGAPRIGADYIWHFDSFNSSAVRFYAGPGVVLGIGEYRGGWWYRSRSWPSDRGPGIVGVGIRGVLGINIIPENSPIEMFFEGGPLLSVTPGTFSAFDLALGIRFYP